MRRYSRVANVNNLRRNESWPTAAAATAATSTRRPRQSGRNISRKSRFSTQDLFGLPNGNANKQQGQARLAKKGGGGDSGSCCKLCGRFRFGFGIDFAACRGHFHKFRIVYLYDSCAQFSIESEEFAWRDLPEIYRRFID